MPAARVRVTLRSGCPWDGQCGAAGTGLRCGQQDGSDKPTTSTGPTRSRRWIRVTATLARELPARLGHPPGDAPPLQRHITGARWKLLLLLVGDACTTPATTAPSPLIALGIAIRSLGGVSGGNGSS